MKTVQPTWRRPTGEPDGSLAAYARDLADLGVLTPEQEVALGLLIEARDLLLWERLLGFAPVAAPLVARLRALVPAPPAEVGRLGRATGAARRRAVKAAAAVLRKLDPDREVASALIAHGEALVAARPTRALIAWRDRVRAARAAADEARQEFVRHNLRLVFVIARRFRHDGLALGDLIQEGNLGLIKAVDRFDPRRGLRFSTYATWWIRHHVGRAIADKARLVRIPVHRLDAQTRVARARRSARARLGREPTELELAAAADVPVSKVRAAITPILSRPISLDVTMGDDDGDRPLYDRFRDPEAEADSPLEALVDRAALDQLGGALARLRPLEAEVLRRRFGLGETATETLAEIASDHGLSRERIRQIEAEALGKLRRVLAQSDGL